MNLCCGCRNTQGHSAFKNRSLFCGLRLFWEQERAAALGPGDAPNAGFTPRVIAGIVNAFAKAGLCRRHDQLKTVLCLVFARFCTLGTAASAIVQKPARVFLSPV